jgi:hypothetical protein
MVKRNLWLFFCLTFVPFLIGVIIYICFRPINLLYFHWLESIGMQKHIEVINNVFIQFRCFIPKWVLYSLPDGLWCFSLNSLFFLIWKNSYNLRLVLFISFIICISTEMFQKFNIIAGYFDILDLFFIILALTTSTLINLKIKK